MTTDDLAAGLRIDLHAAERLHRLFRRRMEDMSGGVPFQDYEHPFFVDDETAYKWRIYHEATELLQKDRWPIWSARRPGRIVERLQQATESQIARNLIITRYGRERAPQKALYLVQDSPGAMRALESLLLDLFINHGGDEQVFGTRFDALAVHLREHRLGSSWTFLSYLSLLAFQRRCFPIRPSRFDELLEAYGIDSRISGHVSWERYRIALALADAVAAFLRPMHGQPDAIQIQSYLWVVGGLLRDESLEVAPGEGPIYDAGSELQRRERSAARREEIGMRGEQIVYQQEQSRLEAAGRQDLAGQMRFVSFEDSSAGYDIESFTGTGEPRRIEVKSTEYTRVDDQGFWLSENERRAAETVKGWTVYRVWSVSGQAVVTDLGNVCGDHSEWAMEVATWRVKPRSPT